MSEKNVDPTCIFSITRNPNLLVPWYLMSSFAYYMEDNPIISDSLYDTICNRLKEEWNSISHRHKDVIDLEALSAGTGFQMKEEDYPSIVRGAISHLREEMSKEKVKKGRKKKA